MTHPAELVTRVRSHAQQRRRASAFQGSLTVNRRHDLMMIGDPVYGGYELPAQLLGKDSVCYLAGTGEDITFDLGVIARFGCTVRSMDPVPRAARHVAVAAAHEPRLVFEPSRSGPPTRR